MSKLFGRSYKLTIDDIEIEGGGVGSKRYGLDIKFRVQSSTRVEPNKIDLQVYNLNPDHRSSLLKESGSQVTKAKRKPVAAVLEAGYADDRGVIFRGELRNLTIKRDGADFVADLSGTDAGRAFNVASLSKSYAPGTSVMSIVQDAVTAMGVGTGNLSTFSNLKIDGLGTTFPEGHAVNNAADKVLSDLLRRCGLSWSVQKGVLQVKKLHEPVDEQVYYLSADTGLIGTPEPEIDATVIPTTTGQPRTPVAAKRTGLIKVRTLLLHQLYPGAKVVLDSVDFKGGYQIVQLIHSGDTSDNDWYSDLLVRQYT